MIVMNIFVHSVRNIRDALWLTSKDQIAIQVFPNEC